MLESNIAIAELSETHETWLCESPVIKQIFIKTALTVGDSHTDTFGQIQYFRTKF